MSKYNPIFAILISLLCGVIGAMLFYVLNLLVVYAINLIHPTVQPEAAPPLWIMFHMLFILIGMGASAVISAFYAHWRYRSHFGFSEPNPSFKRDS